MKSIAEKNSGGLNQMLFEVEMLNAMDAETIGKMVIEKVCNSQRINEA